MKIIFAAFFLLHIVVPGLPKALENGNKVILRRHRNAEYYVYPHATFYGQTDWSTIKLRPTGFSRAIGFDRRDVIIDIPPMKEALKPGVRVLAKIRTDIFPLQRSLYVPSEVIKENNGEYIVKPICENKAPPLGVSDNYIFDKLPDDAFTASSYDNDKHKPSQARLEEEVPWCAASDDMTKPWLQVDLQMDAFICSVTTKLYVRDKKAVTAFTLAVSRDNQVWHHLMENDKTRKIFRRDFPNNYVDHFLNLVDTSYRYIRFYPVSYRKRPCMAVEINGYGNFPIPPHSLTIDRLRMEGSRCNLQNECVKTLNAECGKEGQNLGTYKCRCKSGFKGPFVFEPEAKSVSCSDIDECQHDDVCGKFSTCTNTPGSYKCNCKKGYENPNGILSICKDINECLSSPCSSQGRCTNTDGSFTCQCKYGYQGNGYTCVDTDECNPGNGTIRCKGKHSKCINLPGSYECVCQAGFTGDGNTCTDINECEGVPNPCKAIKGKCFNSIGSYKCTCLNGYKLKAGICQEIDECASPDTNDCNQHAKCTNKPGSYSCDCKQGFTGGGYDAFGCSDIDECSEKNTCGAHSSCKNSEGSFTCTCDKGYTSHNGMNCLDIDECKADKAVCHHLATCKNLLGSFTCLCPAGYKGKGDVTDGCKAMTWCEWKGNAKCNKEFRHCDNRLRRCTDCKSGYEEKSGTCQDINECAKSPCGKDATCVNTPGSFKCRCHKGYILNSQTNICEDINECSSSKYRCHVDAVCENSPGSYSCKCKKGFGGDGFYCADTNECYIGAYKCPQNSVCSNTLGSYKCTCKMGYHRSEDKCEKDGTSKKTKPKKDSEFTSLFDLSFLWSRGSSLRSQARWKLLLFSATVIIVKLFV